MSDPGGQYSDKDFLDYENLIRLGLVDRIEIKRKPLGRFDIDVHYYVLWAHSSRPRLPERAGIAIFMLLTRPAYGL
jgi:hypothetical protein